MDIFIGVLVGLFVLMFLVTAHEFGHFIMARKNGVRVLEFGIGFPPRAVAWIKKAGKWQKLPKSDAKKPQKSLILSLNWLPIGGFCQMDGESAADTRPGTFGAARFSAKTKILFGGVMMNWLIAWAILTILAWTGMPTFLNNQFTIKNDTRLDEKPIVITNVAPDSPAATAGFKIDDQLLKINNEKVATISDVTNFNAAHPAESATYTVRRICEAQSHCEIDLTATLNPEGSAYLLGITMSESQSLAYSTWSAPITGLGLTAQLTAETFKGVGDLIYNLSSGFIKQFDSNQATRESGKEAINAAGQSVSGPVGIIGIVFPAFTAAGPTNLAFLAALISISLACMNVLPIPALDGGRWLLIAIYKLLKKPLKQETEEKIVSRAFAALLLLILLITILDITRFF